MVHHLFGWVQHYDWGDPEFIPRYLNEPTDGRPWAEVWFGTHPSGPARIDAENGALLESVSGPMTMLVKVLACRAPLSLQTHPTITQAREGHAREEAAGIPRHDPRRMYRDESDKPEMIVALTRFEALCGFRDTASSIAALRRMNWDSEAATLASHGIAGYLRWSFEQQAPPSLRGVPSWLTRIASIHPDDPGLRVAPLLHHVVLQPGQALALPAGNLHAYMSGAGIEVMNSSDNVVRAGFTTKHVDVDELLRIVDTSVLVDPVARPDVNGMWEHYPSPTDQFSVARFGWRKGDRIESAPTHRIVLGIHGHSGHHAGALFVPAGETLEMGPNGDSPDSGTVWVCTQN